MTTTARRIEHIADKAEGDCCGLAYTTELASINGVSVHFWIGDRTGEDAQGASQRQRRKYARNGTSST